MRAHLWVGFALALGISLPPSVARAQKDAAVASARTHFAVGVKLYDATPPDYSGALAEFQEAYRAKPSPGIMRNVALCLKGLHRYPEAIEALEQMLQEGGGTLSPEVQDAAQKAIAELLTLIATVRVRIVPHVTSGRVPEVALSVDGAEVPAEKYAQPLRLMPGEHVFKARAAGFFEALQTTKVAAGDKDIGVVIEMVAIEIIERGRLTVRANVSTATISIDGITVGTERWTGDLRAGMHRVDVVAQGYPPYAVQVNVPPNEARELPVDMSSAPTKVPEPYPGPPAKKLERNWFATGGLAIQGESLRFGPALDEVGNGTRRSAVGATLILNIGRKLTPYFDALIFGEIGALSPASYTSPNGLSLAKVTITNWVLAPELRVHTRGSFRALAGIGAGLAGQSVSADLGTTDASGTGVKNVTGSAAAGMLLAEVGGQLDLGRAFAEATLFADVHGIGGATATTISGGNGTAHQSAAATEQRFFLDSPAIRGGVRLLFGFTF